MSSCCAASTLRRAVLVGLLLFAAASGAQSVQFSLQANGGERLLSLNTIALDGIDYAPLEMLVQQAGGSYNALPARLRVDLGGSTAWLRVGESRVNALSIFSLKHPVREDSGVPLIAVMDIPDFFLKSFRAAIQPATPQTPVPIATQPGLATPPATAPLSRPLAPMDEPEALEQLGDLPVAPVAVSRIVIDAGHGGYDTGVQSGEALSEESVTLAVAERLKSLLTTDGRFTVVLTREDDADLSFSQRAAAAGTAPGTLLVSLHVGSSASPAAEGIAVFYPTPKNAPATGTTSVSSTLLGVDHRLLVEGKKFADALAASLTTSAGVPLRGVLEAPLRMQSDMEIVTAQVELGCLTSLSDAQRLSTEGYLARLATGLFDGIVTYVHGPQSDPAAALGPAGEPSETTPAAVEN